MIGELTVEEVQAMLQDIVFKLRLKATEPEMKELQKYISYLAAYIINKYRNTGNKEIVDAYEMYVSGDLPMEPIRQLDIISFNQVMKAYRKHQGTQLHNLIEGQMLVEQGQEYEPTPVEVEQINRSALALVYYQLKAGKTVIDYGNGLYDWLDKTHGLVPFTPERKRSIYAQAQEQLRSQASWASIDLKNSGPKRQDAKKLQDLFTGSIAGTATLSGDPLKAAVSLSKQLAFVRLLTEWMEQDVALSDMLPPAEGDPEYAEVVEE